MAFKGLGWACLALVIGGIPLSCGTSEHEFSDATGGGGAGADFGKFGDTGLERPGQQANGGSPTASTGGEGGHGGSTEPESVGAGAGGVAPVETVDGGSSGGPPTSNGCDADLQTDRLNCGECDHVCHAPYDCAKGECGVCANGCAVLSASVTAQKRQSLFQITPNDYFTPNGPISMTAYVATGTKVTVTFSAVYEEGGRTDIGRSFTSGDWVTLTVVPEPAKGPVMFMEVTINEVSTVKPKTTLYVEEVVGIPGAIFEFERSVGDVIAVLPVDDDPGKPYYVLGDVDWLGPL